MLKPNLFDLFLDKIFNVPLWTKQVVFSRLYKDIERLNCNPLSLLENENTLSTYKPILTYAGLEELNNKHCGLDINCYNFLNACYKDMTILETSMNSFLSIEEVVKLFEFCIDQGFLKKPDSKELMAMIGFISGKFRVGEYFRQIDKITVEQLEGAIIEYQKNPDRPFKFCQILIKLGYIDEYDYKALIILKEEAKKRFILDYNAMPELKVSLDEKAKYEHEIDMLKNENLKLRAKMLKLVEIIKENQNAI
ncbi:MAG: hypothetical protein R3Y28_00605 [Candidatus Gastranaerophilales bacterium]